MRSPRDGYGDWMTYTGDVIRMRFEHEEAMREEPDAVEETPAISEAELDFYFGKKQEKQP